MRTHHGLLLSFFLMLVVLSFIASISFGIADIDVATIYNAIFHFDGSREHLIIMNTRVPRACIALAVGACLAVAGGIMQNLTRNGLAAPEIIGINHGASLFVVIAIFIFNINSLEIYTWFAFAGAALVSFTVYSIGVVNRTGVTPIRLILAGTATTALLASFVQAILILSEQSLDQMRFWLAGSIVGRDISNLIQVLPFMILGLLLASIISKPLAILSLGEEVATSLGQRTSIIKTLAILSTVLLAGSAVAVAGPIAFLGLAVPHIVRSMLGNNHNWFFPFSAVLGALLLLIADTSGRFIIPNQELPVGVMTAIAGVPFFIYLARKRAQEL